MTNNTDLLFLNFLNMLDFFSKLTKNNINLIVSNIFLFQINYFLSKSTI